LQRRYRVTALVRSPILRSMLPVSSKSQAISTMRLAPRRSPAAPGASAHLAPPTGNGALDIRTRNLLAALDPADAAHVTTAIRVPLSSGSYGRNCAERMDRRDSPAQAATGRACGASTPSVALGTAANESRS